MRGGRGLVHCVFSCLTSCVACKTNDVRGRVRECVGKRRRPRDQLSTDQLSVQKHVLEEIKSSQAYHLRLAIYIRPALSPLHRTFTSGAASRIDFARSVLDFKVELCQLRCPLLFQCPQLCRAEVGQRIVICDDREMFTKQVMSEFFRYYPVHGKNVKCHVMVVMQV